MADNTANLIDVTTNVLSQNTFCFDNLTSSIKYSSPIIDSTFGILNFTTLASQPTTDEIELLFKVDCSGSMEEVCSAESRCRNKMSYIIHTLKNIMSYLHDRPHISAYVTIDAFDTCIYEIVQRTKITPDTINLVLEKISAIQPLGSTNIETALTDSFHKIKHLKETYSNHSITHIFMTDGHITDGSTHMTTLQSHIDSSVGNVFIGFGIHHDTALLTEFSKVNKGSYYFIDKLESAGLVYGEILHSIVYKLVTNVSLHITNGLLYNFKTNSWNSSVQIDDIVSDTNKTFNFVTHCPNECSVHISGTIHDLVTLFPSKRMDACDLTPHKYRQKTLQLLAEVSEYFIKNHKNINANVFAIDHINASLTNGTPISSKQNLKQKLFALIAEMKEYNNVDHFIKNLCNDLQICYKTIDSEYGQMFCTARMSSQGAQRQYAASDMSSISKTPASSRRGGRPTLQRMDTPSVYMHDDFEDIDSECTPYISSQVQDVMRELSQQPV